MHINLLKLLLDIPGMGRDKLLADGFQFSIGTFTKAVWDKEQAGMHALVTSWLDASWITMTICRIRHELAVGFVWCQGG